MDVFALLGAILCSATSFRSRVKRVLHDIAIDLNAELGDLGEKFDYRRRLREESWVKGLWRTTVADYEKQVARNRIPSFAKDWSTIE